LWNKSKTPHNLFKHCGTNIFKHCGTKAKNPHNLFKHCGTKAKTPHNLFKHCGTNLFKHCGTKAKTPHKARQSRRQGSLSLAYYSSVTRRSTAQHITSQHSTAQHSMRPNLLKERSCGRRLQARSKAQQSTAYTQEPTFSHFLLKSMLQRNSRRHHELV
jgi:hypothetical protein